MKNYITYGWVLFLIGTMEAQVDDQTTLQEADTTEYVYMVIEGDTIPRQYITLNEVILLKPLQFDSEEARKDYLILRRRTRKVYPYAKLAAERLMVMNERLSAMERKSQRRKYIKIVQKYLEEEFAKDLKNMTRSEGRILVKLIHRQTGQTVYELVKEFRSGWRAFRYNTTASLFNISLKSKYEPATHREDFLIEDILLRSFQEGILEEQASATPIDYLELSQKWKE
ncbi:MAG TPA: DUF4294 domain-containing protein [Flavobacteriaceae bacterium]|nr:DUF4294 domain-containing protein [Flavobacteriaceae bacterium]